jgi:hypothetical protein
MLPPLSSFDLHLDWWGKCRTCAFWVGDRQKGFMGGCSNPKSDLGGTPTSTEGYCKKWDSYDIETALDIMRRGL